MTLQAAELWSSVMPWCHSNNNTNQQNELIQCSYHKRRSHPQTHLQLLRTMYITYNGLKQDIYLQQGIKSHSRIERISYKTAHRHYWQVLVVLYWMLSVRRSFQTATPIWSVIHLVLLRLMSQPCLHKYLQNSILCSYYYKVTEQFLRFRVKNRV